MKGNDEMDEKLLSKIRQRRFDLASSGVFNYMPDGMQRVLREDIPDLLEEIERLTAEVDRLHAENDDLRRRLEVAITKAVHYRAALQMFALGKCWEIEGGRYEWCGAKEPTEIARHALEDANPT